MTKAQTKLHWQQWNQALRAMRGLGLVGPSVQDAAHARMAIYNSLEPICTSSKDMSNAQLTQFLQICWAWSQPGLARLQLRGEHQGAIIGRWLCRQVFDLVREVDPERPPASDRYFDAIFAKLNPGVTPDFGSIEEWQKVVIACIYRYDQIARKVTGSVDRCWPARHGEHLLAVKRQPEPEHAENPF